jgi:cytochrome c peroxidase
LVNSFRASVARGSDLFFNRRFDVPEAVQSSSATCATCHQGGVSRSMDIGTTDRPDLTSANDLPLFRITCDNAARPHPLLGRVIYTEDPGRALATGKCADVGSIVMQQLRGLAARAPYFANGSAKTLKDVVDFYDRRFSIGYSDREKRDLINFLSVL